jgi:hypothetical protein
MMKQHLLRQIMMCFLIIADLFWRNSDQPLRTATFTASRQIAVRYIYQQRERGQFLQSQMPNLPLEASWNQRTAGQYSPKPAGLFVSLE